MKATFYQQGTGAVTYVRNTLPCRYLPAQSLDLEDRQDLAENDAGEIIFPRVVGPTVWSFPGNQTRARIMAGMRVRGHRVLVEVDDLYLVQPPDPTKGQARRPWTQAIDGTDGHSSEGHTRIVENLAQGVIVATEALGREYLRVNKNVHVCENSVDPIDWDYEKPSDGVFRVGFAGSASHLIDFGLIVTALHWASKQANVEVILLGSIGKNVPWATHVPWTEDLDGYRKSLFQLDVGLCPLRPGRWANCKSDLKVLEYTMAGCLPIVSRVEPYRDWISHDSPLLSADNRVEFEKQLKWCVRHQDEARDRASACKAKVLNERTIQGNVWKWDEALKSVEGGA